VIEALRKPGYVLKPKPDTGRTEIAPRLKARQILGQPAGPGIARGKARVILNPSNLFDFKSGEILVVDAIDPNMTFVVPISAGIVERRGGMLIHGAIIA
jgi:pyruvate,water dikinase